jgi:hypothetical protein
MQQRKDAATKDSPLVHQSTCSEQKSRDDNAADTLADDRMHPSTSGHVVPQCKLTFFAFPKVACSEWKPTLVRTMNGNPDWCVSRDPHDPKKNRIKNLQDCAPEIATFRMTSPEWTKVAILREPKERVLAAFLDEAVNEADFDLTVRSSA